MTAERSTWPDDVNGDLSPEARRVFREWSAVAELEFQLDLFTEAWEALQSALPEFVEMQDQDAALVVPNPELDAALKKVAIRVWLHAYSATQTATRIGRLLSWSPSDGGRLGRDIIGWADDAFSGSGVRNALTHFEERLATWLDEGNGYVHSAAIVPLDRWGPLPFRVLRLFDTETMRVYFRDESIDLRAVNEAVRDLARVVAAWDKDRGQATRERP